LAFLVAALLPLAAAVVACSGGGGSGDDPVRTPPGGFSGGGTDITVRVGADTWEYKDGICVKGDGDSYLEVDAGNAATDEYFGLLAGAYPGAPGTPVSAAGGGDFAGRDHAILHIKHNRREYLVSFADTTVTLAPDISSGSFVARSTAFAGDAGAVSGTFTCGKK
jgi:hypothetical protein